MKQINGTSLLVTVAEDLSNEPVLKVWALDTELKDGTPRCLSTVSVQNARRQFPVRIPHRVEEYSEELIRNTDIGLCSCRRPFAGCGWIRQRLCDDHPG
jgi:hypothetical protein